MGIVEELFGLNYRQAITLNPKAEPHSTVFRGDHGTKNVIVCGIQRFLCRNHTDSQSKDKSLIYGHSAANQRIESWWFQLFKSITS